MRDDIHKYCSLLYLVIVLALNGNNDNEGRE